MKKNIIKSSRGRLEGKVAIITGGNNGMGAAHARKFIDEGAKVVIVDILEEEGAALTEELGENIRFIKRDVRKLSDYKYVIRVAEETFGPVDILVNNAGIFSSNDRQNFTFEGKQYYAVYNAPGYNGLMIFTAGGVAMQEYQFPELWMYYRHQENIFQK
jgi:NAD(P)-dependent dehydrogenase (short-subunit alcohol dehydrogenase family)